MNSEEIIILKASQKLINSWLTMRIKLWPNHSINVHKKEIRDILNKRVQAAFIAFLNNNPVGFVECSIRKKVDGCETNNVGYIEGWFVDNSCRKQGLGRQLIEQAENWAKKRGSKDMSSDCLCDNKISQKAHIALGYKDYIHLIHFKKH